jgi:hypothetical protein
VPKATWHTAIITLNKGRHVCLLSCRMWIITRTQGRVLYNTEKSISAKRTKLTQTSEAATVRLSAHFISQTTDRGVQIPVVKSRGATKLCTGAHDICGPSVGKPASCHPSGAYNFEVAPTFLEDLCTPVYIYAYIQWLFYSYIYIYAVPKRKQAVANLRRVTPQKSEGLCDVVLS